MMVKTDQPPKVDILILGAGWTSTFLIPLLKEGGLTYAATTTTGRDGTYKFKFEHDADGEEGYTGNPPQYAALPVATTILITFPLRGKLESSHLIRSYVHTHGESNATYQWIQLGSTGIWSIPGQETWVTRHSKYDKTDTRAIAEEDLISLGGCVLDLSGLWGGQRQVKHWFDKVAKTKEQLSEKKALHMIHGEDVSRAIIAVHGKFKHAAGQRWMLTDLVVYDWWLLILDYGAQLDRENGNEDREETQMKWVGELMVEQNVRALPRSMEQLGRAYDTREFWATFGLMPVRARV